MNKCEVCDSNELIEVLDLGLHPICDDLIKIGDKRQNELYPIVIMYCPVCYTAHQKFQIPKEKLFPSNYHYRARFTKDVLEGMSSLVDDVEKELGSLEGKIVLDIGCNDGSLLNFFKAKGSITYGIEPTDSANDAISNGHCVNKTYFTTKVASNWIFNKPDIIVFTNVFAHIEDLNGLLEALKIIMKEDTLLVIENHYLGSILDKNQFDTFYHEHPRTYSLMSFAYIANKLGRNLTNYSFPSRYGGNIRVIISNKPSKNIEIKEDYFINKFVKLNQNIKDWGVSKRLEILEAIRKNRGPIEAKAFPARSAIPINLLSLDERHIKCIYEKSGSLKIGNYIPGTRIPIISDDEIKNISEKNYLLNLAWHISPEIEKYLRDKGFKGELINII